MRVLQQEHSSGLQVADCLRVGQRFPFVGTSEVRGDMVGRLDQQQWCQGV